MGGHQEVKPQVPDVALPYVDAMNGLIGQAKNDKSQYTMNANEAGTLSALAGYNRQMVPTVQNYLAASLRGDFLSPESNPWLQATLRSGESQLKRTMGQTLDQLDSSFGQAGHSISSGASQGYRARAIADALGNYGNTVNNSLFSNYQNERQNQLGSMGYANMPVSMLSNSLGAYALPRQLSQNEYMLPFNMYSSMLQSLPIGYPSYAPNDFLATMQGIGSIMNAAGGVAKAANG